MSPVFVVFLGADAVSPGHSPDARCLLATGQRESVPDGPQRLRLAILDVVANAHGAGPIVVGDPAPEYESRIHRRLGRDRPSAGEDQRRRSELATAFGPGGLHHVPAFYRRARR